MPIIEAAKRVYTNYVGFQGRAGRPEFWWFVLFYVLVAFIISLLAGLIPGMASIFALIGNLFMLASLLPNIAVSARRLHDIGKSGWWMLVPLYNIYLYAQPSQAGDNEFGSPAPAL